MKNIIFLFLFAVTPAVAQNPFAGGSRSVNPFAGIPAEAVRPGDFPPGTYTFAPGSTLIVSGSFVVEGSTIDLTAINSSITIVTDQLITVSIDTNTLQLSINTNSSQLLLVAADTDTLQGFLDINSLQLITVAVDTTTISGDVVNNNDTINTNVTQLLLVAVDTSTLQSDFDIFEADVNTSTAANAATYINVSGDTFTGQVDSSFVGSSAFPSFATEPGKGIYSFRGLSFAVDGATFASFDTGSGADFLFRPVRSFTFSLKEDGIATNPAIFWESNENMGIYRSSTDELGFSVNGVETARFGVTGSTFATNVTAPFFEGDGSKLTAVTDATKVLKTGDTMTGDLIVEADVSINGGDLTLGGTYFITPGGHQLQNYAGNGGLRISVADGESLIIQSSASYASGISTNSPTLFYIIKGNNDVSFDPNAFIGYEDRAFDFFGVGQARNFRFLDLEGNASQFGAWTWSTLNLSPLRINLELMSLKENEGTPDATLLVNGTITTTSMTILGDLQLTDTLDEGAPTLRFPGGGGFNGASVGAGEVYVSIGGVHHTTFSAEGLAIAGNFTAAKVTAGTVIVGNIIIVENSRVNLDAFVGKNFTSSETITANNFVGDGSALTNLPVSGVADTDTVTWTSTHTFQAHIHLSGGTDPAVDGGTCGTGGAVSGTDGLMFVTIGTGSPSTCGINFSTTYSSLPGCVRSQNIGTAVGGNFIVTTSSITFHDEGSGLGASDFTVICFGG